jgi:hypothetical protein
MIGFFYVVCGASVAFFAVFFVACSTQGRRKSNVPTVHKLSRDGAMESAADRQFLVSLERELADFAVHEHQSARRAAS